MTTRDAFYPVVLSYSFMEPDEFYEDMRATYYWILYKDIRYWIYRGKGVPCCILK